MSLIKIAGYQWSLDLIDWGSPGRGKRGTLSGYDPKREAGKKGRPSQAELQSKTVDLWIVEAVYALFTEGSLLYIGEGILGDCLYRHHRTDGFAGRWDSFSWVSPWDLDTTSTPPELKPWDGNAEFKIEGKQLVELLETVLIRLTEPVGNRQNPSSDGTIKWLDQTTPKEHMTLEAKVDLILSKLDSARPDVNAEQRSGGRP